MNKRMYANIDILEIVAGIHLTHWGSEQIYSIKEVTSNINNAN